jgi:endogenous inhibitor of DNA gyrase (YacG/DUF329 family)
VAQRLRCPTCQRPIQWSEQFPFRPFCSDRCRLIDLGTWLSEKHAIAGDPAENPDQAPPDADQARDR